MAGTEVTAMRVLKKVRVLKTMTVACVALAGAVTAAQVPARSVPSGTQMDLLLQTALSSGAAKVADRFEATNLRNLELKGEVVVPAGAVARGFVSSVRPSGKIDHQGQMTLSFDELRIGGQTLRLRASIVIVLDPKRRDDTSRSGLPPVMDDGIDRTSAPLVGVVTGAGGSLLSTNGSDVRLPVGAMLRIRLDRPLDLPVLR